MGAAEQQEEPVAALVAAMEWRIMRMLQAAMLSDAPILKRERERERERERVRETERESERERERESARNISYISV